ncbi:hypothetical protein A2368_00555 [Candidatus Collierbacteria bacterium RIFOXYB1_FULL_49_13]|uniref:Uncharacterized protein n=1 Tax=Candidatus Collierbacteria bacterium RIFOXYB1_FULL_49_13 TaxID=1817728 RepID=A0A1F5FHF2_9BACT|nr:MAG: hypothetical protein A2368_00555 [Candidatus Collierbacteria bacterium RIFOXYB1_FULL_49_13]
MCLFAIGLFVYNPKFYQAGRNDYFFHEMIQLKAATQEDAHAQTLERFKSQYPESLGWSDHQVLIHLISDPSPQSYLAFMIALNEGHQHTIGFSVFSAPNITLAHAIATVAIQQARPASRGTIAYFVDVRPMNDFLYAC